MKTKLLVICMTVALFIGCGKSPSEMIQIGENHLNNKEYDSALTSFKVVFEKHIEDPLAPKAGYQVARIYLDNFDDYDNGFEVLRKISANFPESEIGIKCTEELQQFPHWLFDTAESKRDSKNITGSIGALTYLVQKFPQHPVAPKSQYLVGDIYMNDQRNFELAIKSYRKIIADFPGSKQEPHAQFMIGYIYANVMDDSENARKEYSIFLQKYPDHELTPSVKFELDYIGKDINDIPQLKHITS